MLNREPKRPDLAPLVPGFAIDETTALEWTTQRTTITAEIATEEKRITLRNLIAEFGEASKPCFVTHYDSKLMSPGANDNASGVAVLLAMLANWNHNHPARFIFFDGEEAGLLGSRSYVNDLAMQGKLGEISCVINPDSVGLDELYLYAADQFGPFPDNLLNRARRVFADHGWILPERAAQSGSSDYRRFHELGIPCLFLSDYPNHLRHTTHDRAEAISPQVLARLARTLAPGLTRRFGKASPLRRSPMSLVEAVVLRMPLPMMVGTEQVEVL